MCKSKVKEFYLQLLKNTKINPKFTQDTREESVRIGRAQIDRHIILLILSAIEIKKGGRKDNSLTLLSFLPLRSGRVCVLVSSAVFDSYGLLWSPVVASKPF